MTAVNDFERVIKQDRASRESKQWRGTLLEYFEVVKADPMFTKLSHARVYDLIIAKGMHNIQEADDPRTKRLYKDEPVKVYHFFADEFFGIERNHLADRTLLPLGLAQGRGKPPGALSDGSGGLGQKLAGRARPARTRSRRARSTPLRAARCMKSRCT